MKRRKHFREIVVLTLAAILALTSAACGAQAVDPTGSYTFQEMCSGSSGRSDFSQRNWTLEFTEDGSYVYQYDEVTTSGGFGGPSETTTTRFVFHGAYTVSGDTVQCAAPESGTSQVISVVGGEGNPVTEDPEQPRSEQPVEAFLVLTSSFFGDDQSCDWHIDQEAGTATPANYREPVSNRDNNDEN